MQGAAAWIFFNPRALIANDSAPSHPKKVAEPDCSPRHSRKSIHDFHNLRISATHGRHRWPHSRRD